MHSTPLSNLLSDTFAPIFLYWTFLNISWPQTQYYLSMACFLASQYTMDIFCFRLSEDHSGKGGEWVVTTKSFIVASILDYFFSLHGTKCVQDIIWIYYKSIFISLSRQKYSKTDLHRRLSVNLWCIWFFSKMFY